MRTAPLACLALLTSVTAGTGCGPGVGPTVEPTLANLKKNVFEPRCSATVCHGGAGPAAHMSLVDGAFTDTVDVASEANPDVKRVVPGDPDNSLLYLVLLGPAEGVVQMPKGSGVSLPQEDLDLVKAWIEAGALDN